MFGCGSLFVLYTALIYLAVGIAKDREQLLEIALLNYLWPALTILFSVILLKRPASLLLVPGTVLALIGVFLAMTQSAHLSWSSFIGHLQTNPAAYALALGAALAWALYSNLARLWSGPGSRGAVELFIPVTGLALLWFASLRTNPPSGMPGRLQKQVFLAGSPRWRMRCGMRQCEKGICCSWPPAPISPRCSRPW